MECFQVHLTVERNPSLLDHVRGGQTPLLRLHMEVIVAFSRTENYRLMELYFHRHFGVRAFKQMYALGISRPHSGDDVLITLTGARLCYVL